MVHLRINDPEANPNPHVNFTAAFDDEGRHLLRALAAQVRPIMKQHGFIINSFEEYEYNPVFAGRNWNNGETVELVLRRAGGMFYPTSWLLSTLCHELAHIKHMNHGPAFQALWKRLRLEVEALQARGYFGDGYWSAGRRLGDSQWDGGEGLAEGELPEYVCGGAQSKSRPTARRRKRGAVAPRPTASQAHGRFREVVPTLHTGVQTTKKRKSGTRVRSKHAFQGEGSTLGGGDAEDDNKAKRASSAKAREERVAAIERRLGALKQESEEEDDEEIKETDEERRATMRDAESAATQRPSKDVWKDLAGKDDLISLTDAEFDMMIKTEDDAPTLASSSSTFAQPSAPLGLGRLVQTEVDTRKKEALGMGPVKGKGRTLGGPLAAKPKAGPSSSMKNSPWSCLVCTLENTTESKRCVACETPRGSQTYPGNGGPP